MRINKLFSFIFYVILLAVVHTSLYGEHAGVPAWDDLKNYHIDVEAWWMGHPYNPHGTNYDPTIGKPTGADEVTLDPGDSITDAVNNAPANGRVIYLNSGTYDNFQIIAKSHIQLIGKGGPGSVIIQGYNEIAGGTNASDFHHDYSHFAYEVKHDNPVALEEFTNGSRDVYLSNITFDGMGSTYIGLVFNCARDVVVDNCIFSNFENPGDHHRGLITGAEGLWNIWVRHTEFVGDAIVGFYLDGPHGCGLMNNVFHSNNFQVGVLWFCNDDFTKDVNANGVWEPWEKRNAQYCTTFSNVFGGGWNRFAIQTGEAQNMLTLSNLALESLPQFQYNSDRCSQMWFDMKYYGFGNKVIGNTVNDVDYLIEFDSRYNLCLINECFGNYGEIGRASIRGNTVNNVNDQLVYSHGYKVFGPMHIEGNRVNGAGTIDLVMDNAFPTVSVTNLTDGQSVPMGKDLHFRLDANDSDGEITRLELYVDYVLIEEKTNDLEYLRWAYGDIEEGDHTVYVKAWDDQGRFGYDLLTITADHISESASFDGQNVPVILKGEAVGTKKTAYVNLTNVSSATSAVLWIASDDIDEPKEASMWINGTKTGFPCMTIHDGEQDDSDAINPSLLVEGSNALTFEFSDDLSGSTTGFDIDDFKITLGYSSDPGPMPPTAEAGTNQFKRDVSNTGYVTFSLDGSGSLDDSSITNYRWAYGFSNYVEGETTTVTLPVGETYKITLTVTDDEGIQDIDMVYLTAEVPVVYPETGYTYVEDGGQVVIEGENATGIKAGTGTHDGLKWRVYYSSNRSGSNVIMVENNDVDNAEDTNGPGVYYNINFSNTGTYNVYLLAYGEASGDDSAHTGLNGSLDNAEISPGITGSWKWTDGGTVDVSSAGIHRFWVYMREDGFQIDKIVLKTADVAPSGDGPDESVYTSPDNLPPIANAGGNQEIYDSDTNGVETVSFDGSGSYDPDGSITNYTWLTNSIVFGMSESASGSFSVGDHTVTLRVVDDEGAAGTNVITVTISTNPVAATSFATGYIFVESDEEVVMEAENATTNRAGTGTWDGLTWNSVDDTNQSGGKYAQMDHFDVANCESDEGARLDYKIYFSNTGTYNVYARMRAFSTDSGSNGNSFWTGLDGAINTSTKIEVIEGDGWNWENDTVTIQVTTPGYHTFNIWHREKDLSIDKFVLTTGGAPTGLGPDESPAETPSNMPPTADAGDEETIYDTDGNGYESVTLDGSGSSDSDGTITNYIWTTNSVLLTTGTNQDVTLPAGVHTILLTVTDNGGLSASNAVRITVSTNEPFVSYPPNSFYTFIESNGQVVMEAENATESFPGSGTWDGLGWNVYKDTNNVSENRYAQMDHFDDANSESTNGARMDYKIYFSNTGTYNVYARMRAFSTASGSNGNSFWTGLDGIINTNMHEVVEGAGWSWEQDGITIEISNAGYYTFNIWHREKDQSIDKFVLTTGGAPTGLGPDESPVIDPKPIADAGTNMRKTDYDGNGLESFTLDGSASYDGDGGSITNYLWLTNGGLLGFGADLSNTTADFESGTHNVTLWVTDNHGYSNSDSIAVTINTPPTADAGTNITVRDTNNSGSVAVSLDGSSSSDSGGSIANYTWSTNDTVITNMSESSVLISFPRGTYTVTLTVTDNDGATNSDPVNITVNPPIGPTANVCDTVTVSDTDTNGYENAVLTASNSTGGDGTITNYRWETNGIIIAEGSDSVTNADFPLGTNTVNLTIFNDIGLSASNIIKVYVYDKIPPIADAGANITTTNTSTNQTMPVTLDASGSSNGDGSITNYIWSTNGVTITSGANAVTNAELPVGTNTIKLTVTDDNGLINTDQTTIIIYPLNVVPPTADAGSNITVTDTGNNGTESVTLDGSGSVANESGAQLTNYTWSTNDVVFATNAETNVTFPVGTNTIKLTVTDDNGLTDTASITVTVKVASVPVVTSTDPENDESGVGVDEVVRITFSEAMKPDSVEDAVSVQNVTLAKTLNTTITTAGAQNVFELSLDKDYSYGSLIKITISKDAQSRHLVSLTNDYEFTFTVVDAKDLENISISAAVVKQGNASGIYIQGVTSETTAEVYTISGSLIRELNAQNGVSSWDMKNNEGAPVAPGVYLIRLINGESDEKILKVVITP